MLFSIYCLKAEILFEEIQDVVDVGILFCGSTTFHLNWIVYANHSQFSMSNLAVAGWYSKCSFLSQYFVLYFEPNEKRKRIENDSNPLTS
jgi:hypothetical protein